MELNPKLQSSAGITNERPTSKENVIDFYFDFISPFGYFASLKIDELASRYGCTVRWNSMLIGISVLKVMGMKPLLETPLKGPYIVRDAQRYARQHRIQLGRALEGPIVNPRPAGMAFNWLKRHRPDLSKSFAQHIFTAYWLAGRDISKADVLADVLLEVDANRLLSIDDLSCDEAAALLKESVNNSLERGVFGSPFFIAGDEPFFGVEKLGLLEQWLATGGW